MKLTEIESLGLYRTLNDWDPLLFLDGHLMDRVSHGYANTYGTTTVPAAAPGPRDYMHDTLFPAVREMVRKDFGLEVFSHALATPNAWPPTAWSHDRAAWSDMTTLDGAFEAVASREFEAGAFYVDMAQPMANAAFYYLEPQARDGFVGWWVFDEILKNVTAYPVFKVKK